jgi:23S rRNA pseudouridine1911/1915/1917 synthase
VGDPLYGGRLKQPAGATEALRQALHKFPRQALHARKLGLIHPARGEYCEFQAELPADMTSLIVALENDIKDE